TTHCTASPLSAGLTSRVPATTSTANSPPAAPKQTSCACSNAPSLAKCFDTSPRLTRSMTTATYVSPGKPKTSPSAPSPTTSASGPTTSPDSNAASNVTTPSPLTTATG